MSGSGCCELWVPIYTTNSVVQIMSDHAYNRILTASWFPNTVGFITLPFVTQPVKIYEDVLHGEICKAIDV